MLIGLLRHGEVYGGVRFRGHSDDPLTACGLEQMRAALLAEPGWERVISSPLRRCAEFASEFAAHRAVPLSFDERLREIYFGAWEGRTLDELQTKEAAALGRYWRDPEHHLPPDAEPFAEFRARVLALWDQVIADAACRRLLLITHGGVIRVVIGQLLGCSIARVPGHAIRHGGLYRFAVDPQGQARPCFEIATR